MCPAFPNQVVQSTLGTTCCHAEGFRIITNYQQNAYGGNPEEDLLLSDRGSQVPTYLQTKFVSCRWNHVNTCFGCWQETVTQIDDQIIRDGLTNMQFVFKEQVSPKLYGRRSRWTFPLPSPRHLLFKVCFGSQTRHGRTKYHTTSWQNKRCHIGCWEVNYIISQSRKYSRKNFLRCS